MKSTKKLIALVLSVLMMVSMMLCANATTFSDVAETHNRYTAITTLADMGVINGYTDGTFKPDSPVTRAEMAKMVALVFNYGLNMATTSPYTDVPNDHWAINYIATMRDVGVINGFPDGTFLPNGEVTYEQAIKMIICALKWGEVAQQQTVEGDWSSGYRAMASKLGVSKYVYPTSNAEPASRSTIAQLLYNSLEVKPAEKVVDSNGNISYKESDKTLNESTAQSKTEKKVQIITTPKMNIDSSNTSIANGNIRVRLSSGTVITVNAGSNTRVYDYIGRYGDITYNVNSNGEYSLISFIADGDETSFDIKNIKSVASGSIEYYTDADFERSIKLTVENPTVIYNNRALTNANDYVTLLDNAKKAYVSADDEALNFFGTVKFVDSNSGDLIVINSYKSYEVDSFDSRSYRLTLKGLTSPVYMPVRTQAAEGYEIVKKSSLTDTGSVSTSLSVSSGSIVTISQSYSSSIGDKYIEYLINSTQSSITPTGTEIITSRPYYYKKVSTDSKDYYVANETAGNKLVVGATSSYLTDASGDIVLVKSYADTSKRVGFFVSGVDNDDGTTSVTFYDPTDGNNFTVKLKDQADVTKVVNGKKTGELFWMNVSGSNTVNKNNLKIVSTASDGTYDALTGVKVVSLSGSNKASVSGTNYTVTGDATYSSNSYTVKVFTRPDNMAGLNKFSYQTFSMASNLRYENPKVISFKKDNKSYMLMWIDPYKGLLDSSPVYVVKSIGSGSYINETNYKTIICYDFKNGTDGKTVKIEESACTALNLKVGDVFTYYNDCTTAGVDIDKTDNVKILLRASQVASDKNFVNSMGERLTDTSTDTNGYKKYGIYENNIITGTYYNYILSTPLYYDNNDNGTVLYLSKKSMNTMLLGDFTTPLASCVGPNWTFENIKTALPANSYVDVNMQSCRNVFVYDRYAASESEKFYKLSEVTSSTLDTLFGQVNTLAKGDAPADAAGIVTKAENTAMVYTYFSNYDTSIQSILIIK